MFDQLQLLWDCIALTYAPFSPRLLLSNIHGNYCGNNGSNGHYNCGNVVNHNYCSHRPANPAPNYTEIVQCLYTSKYGEHRRRVQEPVEGTCTWVTKHVKYKDWLSWKTFALLWLSADPGCGKSVIASSPARHSRAKTGAIVCYFFFKDDNEEQRSAEYALCAILHQPFTREIALCRYAQEAFMTKGKRFTEEVDTLWDILVKVVAEGGCGDVICVVDGLDECEERTLIPLIRRVTGLPGSRASGAPLKFLVTSRPSDVSRVIDHGIKELELTWGDNGGLEYLRSALKRVDHSPEVLTEIVSTAPRDLAQFYTKILDKSVHPVKARRILNIVVAAARPLTLREMNVAFTIRRGARTVKGLRGLYPGFEKTVKNLCGLLVHIIHSRVYLVHQTAREFLIKGSSLGRGNWQYTLSSKDSNFELADICISYLSLEDFENNPLPALLDYVASHWANHFRDSQDRQMELFKFTRVICERGSNRFLTWLKVYWRRNGQYHPFPKDFTSLMIASWFGQENVVERQLEEGRDINARSKRYGTALNIAAPRKDEAMTRMLMRGKVNGYIGGKGYNMQDPFCVAESK
ncbi:hypothetical protein C7212DRAFT_351160 [Tuber magnatum]|uniref:Uncharacterized protein n=1 Tax=Tuber magnatum TaxID=42249 RepID=A0A317SS94_9PEZI|nr:hypothetical protein C7212DRAFT_351160 [Tuber magnatum]